jgi:hypothetical protein
MIPQVLYVGADLFFRKCELGSGVVMEIPEYKNDSQWWHYLTSERLRVRREMASEGITPSTLRRLQDELQGLDENILETERRMKSDSSK